MIAIVNNNPILAVPGCWDNAMDPNDPMVVRALNNMALGVDECISSVSFPTARETK